jgi:PAS domain S-box-containing protein
MRFLNSVKALYSAVGILFLAFVLGYYLDVQNQAMNVRHLEINTLLERTIRLEQELSNMLSLTVVEQNELRATRYETVRQEAEESIKRLIEFTKEMGISKEISAVMESQKNIIQIETVALEKIRSDRWKEARVILLGDEYVSAKKIYEIESEAIPGLVRGEIEGIEKRFGRIKSASLVVRLASLCLLLWIGIAFSRRTSADLAEQMRLQKEISATNEALEERIHDRTKELESTLQRINASEGALKQAAQEQAAIFQSLTLGIAFVKDRIILRGNAKLGELFGRPLDEMIGQTTRIWYKNEEEYLGIGASTYEDLKHQAIHQREQELPRKDGSLFWCLFRVRAFDPQDISHGIVCTLEDITERKQTERELKKRMEELERFMRLTINREKQMIQLKEEINLLLEQAGNEQKYKIVA